MPTIPLVLSIILAIVILACAIFSVCCLKDELPAFAAAFACFAIFSTIMLYKIANYESQYEWVIKNKPTCTKETVKCLTDQLEWVHDSITTASRLSPERVRIINEIYFSDSAHIQLLKANLEHLRNHNKKEN
jgi:hypothetical protein